MEVEDTYFLQAEYVESEDEYDYEEVPVDELPDSSGDEDLETALQNAHVSQQTLPVPISPTRHPEVIEDFVRNYLVEMGMTRTAACFEAEWYQLMQTGCLKGPASQTLPDVYAQNRQSGRLLHELESQVHRYQEAARMAKERFVRLKKERDFHRMHHRRVLQEKNKLIAELKRMKEHFSKYEPMLQELKCKYQAVTREKMLATLEKDRAVSEVSYLQSTLQTVPHSGPEPSAPAQPRSVEVMVKGVPPEPSNPHRQQNAPICGHLTRTGGLQLSKNFQAHSLAVSSLAFHPTKDLLITASDDHTWKLWTLPTFELLMTGTGHSDWLSSTMPHPHAPRLVTGSGDGTVKVWDLTRGKCVLTFAEHRQVVWGCSWHWSGDLVASGGMDHCCKVWDVHSGRSLVTLRGHADSINSVQFMPYSNSVITSSADKTISLWDARSKLCTQTFYGHQHSCNDATPTLQGNNIFSCDCFGTVVQWDVRLGSAVSTWDWGPHAANGVGLDPGGSVLACARGNATLTLVELSTNKESVLEGHKDTVLDVSFSRNGHQMVSSDGVGSIILWQ